MYDWHWRPPASSAGRALTFQNSFALDSDNFASRFSEFVPTHQLRLNPLYLYHPQKYLCALYHKNGSWNTLYQSSHVFPQCHVSSKSHSNITTFAFSVLFSFHSSMQASRFLKRAVPLKSFQWILITYLCLFCWIKANYLMSWLKVMLKGDQKYRGLDQGWHLFLFFFVTSAVTRVSKITILPIRRPSKSICTHTDTYLEDSIEKSYFCWTVPQSPIECLISGENINDDAVYLV